MRLLLIGGFGKMNNISSTQLEFNLKRNDKTSTKIKISITNSNNKFKSSKVCAIINNRDLLKISELFKDFKNSKVCKEAAFILGHIDE